MAGRSIEYRIFDGTDIAPINNYLHGTAVAAMVAGRTLGVAKKATLVLVKFGEDPTLARQINSLRLGRGPTETWY